MTNHALLWVTFAGLSVSVIFSLFVHVQMVKLILAKEVPAVDDRGGFVIYSAIVLVIGGIAFGASLGTEGYLLTALAAVWMGVGFALVLFASSRVFIAYEHMLSGRASALEEVERRLVEARDELHAAKNAGAARQSAGVRPIHGVKSDTPMTVEVG